MMICMTTEYGPLGDLGRSNMGNIIHLRRPVMGQIDIEYADRITRAMALAEWSVSDACRFASIPWPALEGARLGNRILPNKYVKSLVVALLEAEKREAAMLLIQPFIPGGFLVRWTAKNNTATWRDEVAAIQAVVADIVDAIEGGSVTSYELDTIERAVHLAAGMLLDQIEASREQIKRAQMDRVAEMPQRQRIAGARVRAAG